MNDYVKRYQIRRYEGFDPLDAFAIVASSIAVSGTIEDLRMVDRAFQKDFWNKEELNNERITSAV